MAKYTSKRRKTWQSIKEKNVAKYARKRKNVAKYKRKRKNVAKYARKKGKPGKVCKKGRKTLQIQFTISKEKHMRSKSVEIIASMCFV